jgi:hypothetical protein
VVTPVHEVHSSLSAVSEPAASVSLVNDFTSYVICRECTDFPSISDP